MIASSDWEILEGDDGAERELVRVLSVSPLMARLLVNRGLGDPGRAHSFLSPKMIDLPDPYRLPDMETACRRLHRAVREKQRIAVYGDYDVDGLTGTAILVRFLRLFDLEAIPYIPDRAAEGYGLNVEAVERLSARSDLMVTVDCGIRAAEPIRAACRRGLEVIVTDHHLPGSELPPALAVVNPHLGRDEPLQALCGSALAFMLAWGTSRTFSSGKRVEPRFKEFLLDAFPLVTLATIADAVRLNEVNRIFARSGLQLFPHCKFAGLKALSEAVGVPANALPGTRDLSFGMAPRLNAAGRMGDAGRALDLLLTSDVERASRLVGELDRINRQRQDDEKEIHRAARELVAPGTSGIAVAGDDWNPGIVGIVAARIVGEFYRPAVVVGWSGQTGRGSGRSIPGVHLAEVLDECGDLLATYGGHAQAAGFSLARSGFPELARRFDAAVARRLAGSDPVPRLTIDMEVSLEDLGLEAVRELERLAPYGPGNPEALFATRGLRLTADVRRVGRTGEHAQVFLGAGNRISKGIAFRMGERLASLRRGDRVSVAYEPKVNSYRGLDSVELEVRELRVEGS